MLKKKSEAERSHYKGSQRTGMVTIALGKKRITLCWGEVEETANGREVQRKKREKNGKRERNRV